MFFLNFCNAKFCKKLPPVNNINLLLLLWEITQKNPEKIILKNRAFFKQFFKWMRYSYIQRSCCIWRNSSPLFFINLKQMYFDSLNIPRNLKICTPVRFGEKIYILWFLINGCCKMAQKWSCTFLYSFLDFGESLEKLSKSLTAIIPDGHGIVRNNCTLGQSSCFHL